LKGFSKQQQGQRSLAAGGGAYKIDFSAANPSLYIPDIPFPESTPRIWGRDDVKGKSDVKKSIPNAQFNDGRSDVKIESLMPQDMYLGQIVPFEFQISVVGLESPEDGNMTFTAGWSTVTTMGGAFGYDPQIGVLAAFVDADDGAHKDFQEDASVSDFSWSVVNDEIIGVFDVTGFDDGDVVVVEVWLVIMSKFPAAGATGNVHSRLIDAQTLTTKDAINTGEQTVPMMKTDEDSFATPSLQPRVGYQEWLDDYDPRYRPIFVASEELDNVSLFCG
jgi:hypothetical protein